MNSHGIIQTRDQMQDDFLLKMSPGCAVTQFICVVKRLESQMEQDKTDM